MQLPDGFGQVVPYLFVEDADGYLDHLAAALGGTVTSRTVDNAGVLRNGHVHFGHGSLMVSEATADFPAQSTSIYLFVDDADAGVARAAAAGMVVLFDPIDMPYGDRQGGVQDDRGNIWWISQRLQPGPYR
ncbi:MAG: VOC family protein [Myxococcota bacterium]